MDFKLSWIGLIAVIFGILAIVGLFLNWIVVDIADMSVTGWEIFSDADAEVKEYMSFYFFPAVVLALGVVSVILAALEFFGMGNKITRIVLIVLGILIIVLAYLTYNDFENAIKKLAEELGAGGLGTLVTAFVDMGVGLYLTMVGGAGLALAGILGVAGVIPEEN